MKDGEQGKERVETGGRDKDWSVEDRSKAATALAGLAAECGSAILRLKAEEGGREFMGNDAIEAQSENKNTEEGASAARAEGYGE